MSRRPQDLAAQSALDGAVSAFLDLDNRQTYAADAVAALNELADSPDPDGSAAVARARVQQAWQTVTTACLAASEHYLTASSQYALADAYGRPTHVDPAAAQAAFTRVHRELADAAAAVDRFFNQHRKTLEDARTQRAAVPRLAADARAAASAAEQQLTAAEADGIAYRSVLAAADGLIAAVTALNAAGQAPGPVRRAAVAVQEAAREVGERIETARHLGTSVRAARSSVRTRIEAVQTRLGSLPETWSALLREFAAASSADLVGTDATAREELAAARADFSRVDAVLDGDPEQAADLLTSARAHLAAAEAAHTALTERLRRLREIRADPVAAAAGTRFRIRDAQLLVVGRGLVPQWGSVLDAQVARVDRAAADLTGPHPDFWAYATTLDAVQAFVRTVVDRIRSETATR